MFSHALRTSVPSLATAVLFQLFDHATHDPISHSANFRPPTVTCRALQHSLGTAPRPSFPPLNLHRARVHRKSRAASFKSLYRKRANTPCSCRRIALRASDTTLRLLARNNFRLGSHSGRKDLPRGFDWQGRKKIDGGKKASSAFTVQKQQRVLQTHTPHRSLACGTHR